MKKKIVILLATGFEDTEFTASAKILKKNNIGTDFVSVENLDEVEGQEKMFSIKTKKMKDVDFSSYGGLLIPGGSGHKIVLESQEVKELVQKFAKEKKGLYAICAGPIVLLNAGVVEDENVTIHGEIGTGRNCSTKQVLEFENIVTGENMNATCEFAELVSKNYMKIECKVSCTNGKC